MTQFKLFTKLMFCWTLQILQGITNEKGWSSGAYKEVSKGLNYCHHVGKAISQFPFWHHSRINSWLNLYSFWKKKYFILKRSKGFIFLFSGETIKRLQNTLELRKSIHYGTFGQKEKQNIIYCSSLVWTTLMKGVHTRAKQALMLCLSFKRVSAGKQKLMYE